MAVRTNFNQIKSYAEFEKYYWYREELQVSFGLCLERVNCLKCIQESLLIKIKKLF